MHISRLLVHRLLQECTHKKELAAARQVHALMVIENLESLTRLGDRLIRLFSSCGSLLEAGIVFCKVAKPSVYTWHAIVSAHTTHGESGRALELFQRMQQEGTKPNAFVFACTLKACGSIKAIGQGKLIHDQIVRSGLESDVVVGSALVDMYAKCGCLEKARQVFDNLQNRNIVSWGAIIEGYVQHGHGLIALELFLKLQEGDIKPNNVIFLCILKACGSLKASEHGKLIHDQILRTSIDSDVTVASTLIDMYVKCGGLVEAHYIFGKLLNRDVVSWGVMIGGCLQHGHDILALDFFSRMQHAGIKPNKVIFTFILKACGSIGAFGQGRLAHDEIVKSNLESDLAIGSTLVDMYGKCGSLGEALAVFELLPVRNVVSWTAMIAGYSQHGSDLAAIDLFEKMQDEGMAPTKATFLCVLKACASIGSLGPAKLIHAQIVKNGLELDVAIGTALVDLYAKCGRMEVAQELFEQLPGRNVVSWSAMIGGYAQHGHGFAALELFAKMHQEGLRPNAVTFLSAVKACCSVGELDQGKLIHEQLIKTGLTSDMIIGSALVDMYAKCGSLEDSHKVFNEVTNHDVVAWDALIAGYAQHQRGHLALQLFEKMQLEGKKPDKITMLSVLNACAGIGALVQGALIHDYIIHRGFDADEAVNNSLIYMYAKCGRLEEAHNLFSEMPTHDVFSWGAMIGAYAQHGYGILALEIFEEMQQKGIQPNEIIFSSILKACGSIGAHVEGRLIHEQIIMSGNDSDTIVGNALIDMYAKCGQLEQAHKVFNESMNQDVVSWGAMIVGYVQNGHGRRALEIFGKMQEKGIEVNEVLLPCILKACGMVGAIGRGLQIHDSIIASGLELDVVIGSTLVNMYVMCGRLEEARQVFDRLPIRTPVSWGAMIVGYAEHGKCRLAKKCLEDMQQAGLQPHDNTCTSILAACVHAGKVEEGHRYFSYMVEDHGLVPSVEHFNCMVNLLGHAGLLEEAKELLYTMPTLPDMVGWTTLLSACKKYCNVGLGRQCFEQVVLQDPNIAAGYVLMSNIYAYAQMWEHVDNLQELRKYASAWRNPGKAWIEVDTNVQQFIVGDMNYSQNKDSVFNLKKLRRSMQVVGYVPLLDSVLEPLCNKDANALF